MFVIDGSVHCGSGALNVRGFKDRCSWLRAYEGQIEIDQPMVVWMFPAVGCPPLNARDFGIAGRADEGAQGPGPVLVFN